MKALFNRVLQLPLIGLFLWSCYRYENSHDYYFAGWACIMMLELIWLESGMKQ